jgi:dihydrofolate reductase
VGPPKPIPNLRAIVAVAPGGVIGCGGHIPWHLPEDLRHFRALTLNHTVILGRRTAESLGKPLFARDHWLLTRQKSVPPFSDHGRVRIFQDENLLLDAVRQSPEEKQFWVIGGAEIYQLLTPHCSEIVQTVLESSCEGDTYFTMPPFFQRAELLAAKADFAIHRWRRK